MPLRPFALLVVAGAVLLASGCGGGPKTYTLSKTRECLAKESGVRVGGKLDFVATTALGGALAAHLKANDVVISFGLDEAEAERLAAAYRRYRGRNIGIEDVLRPNKNAVLLWRRHPTPEQESTITGCLK